MPEPRAKLAYSVEEFAGAVGLSRNHAYALVRGGELRARKTGTRWVIPAREIERWLEGREDGQTSSQR